MLTLKELKKIVKVADMEKRIPSVKSLKEHKVVVKEMINADTTISVYDHGYVLYLKMQWMNCLKNWKQKIRNTLQ